MRWSSAANEPRRSMRRRGEPADQQQGQGRVGVRVEAGEQAELLELVGVEEVALVNDEDHLLVAFVAF